MWRHCCSSPSMPFYVAGDANAGFAAAAVDDARAVEAALADRGIVVDGCVKAAVTTIPPPAMMYCC